MFNENNYLLWSIIIFSIFFFSIYNIHIYNTGIKIDSDNIMEIPTYEEDFNFSEYSTELKPIALYFPNYYSLLLSNPIKNIFSEWKLVIEAKPLFKGHHQPRIPEEKYISFDDYDLENSKTIEIQIELAKSHGIYGFAFYYYWFSRQKLYEKPLNIFFENKNLDFHFLLIWKNNDLKQNNETIIEQKYDNNFAENFFEDIKKYLNDSRYIRNNGKPMIGIYKPEQIVNIKNTISMWRKKAREYGIGEIFIFSKVNRKNNEILNNLEIFDGGYESPPSNIFMNNLIKSNNNNYYYLGYLYENNNNTKNIPNNFQLYKGVMLEYDNSPNKFSKNIKIFEEYSSEMFYIINKIIINWTKINYDKNNRFIFINSWNNWSRGSYLEPDKKWGYSSINSLSKALFNLPYKKQIYNISNLQNETKIIIQVHAFYEDIMPEIINKTNNIPVKFDLYITTNTLTKKNIIENLIKNNSKANKYEIEIVENKGRDVLPYLTQLQNIIKKYKYICHLHTKKTKFDPILGENWRNYLYNNLFGDEDLISEILTEFENNEELGIIFPETYYYQKGNVIKYNKKNKKYMNYLLNKIYKNINFKIGEKIIFPSGNMFWARVEAIYQVFEQDIKNKCRKEANQYDNTIMHGIERFWIFVAKLNGYYYKTILKYI